MEFLLELFEMGFDSRNIEVYLYNFYIIGRVRGQFQEKKKEKKEG